MINLQGPCYVEGNFSLINPSPAIDARPIEVLKCDANFVLDDLETENTMNLLVVPRQQTLF
jgi:hypothetical protein